jgi:hypothetical protein
VLNVRALLKRLTTDYTDDTDEEYGSPAICLFIGVIRVIRGKNPRKETRLYALVSSNSLE